MSRICLRRSNAGSAPSSKLASSLPVLTPGSCPGSLRGAQLSSRLILFYSLFIKTSPRAFWHSRFSQWEGLVLSDSETSQSKADSCDQNGHPTARHSCSPPSGLQK